MIGAYVQSGYAKSAYAVESYNAREWPGFEMVIDDLRRGGYEVAYCSAGTVAEYRIILVSLTSGCDWWSFIAERECWPRGAYRVIVGGAGLANVRPFLPWFDIAVFGRGDGLIRDVVAAELEGKQLAHPSVCYSDTFTAERVYVVRQVDVPYPHEVSLASGKKWRESTVGCQRKCAFCAYTWQREHIGGKQSDAGAGAAIWGNTEATMFDFDWSNPGSYHGISVIGLDGWSERLRRAVAKPITDDMLRKWLVGLQHAASGCKLRIYNICGYPTETAEDVRNFVRVLTAADGAGKKRYVQVHLTPFRPMPCTPLATWPIADVNYRDFRARYPGCAEAIGKTGAAYLLNGKTITAMVEWTTDSLATVLLDAVVLRGIEIDSGAVRRIACSKRFWSADSRTKTATLRDQFDVKNLTRQRSWSDLPTGYLRGVADCAVLKKAEAVASRRLKACQFGGA